MLLLLNLLMLDVACFGGVTVEDRILDQAQRIVYSNLIRLISRRSGVRVLQSPPMLFLGDLAQLVEQRINTILFNAPVAQLVRASA